MRYEAERWRGIGKDGRRATRVDRGESDGREGVGADETDSEWAIVDERWMQRMGAASGVEQNEEWRRMDCLKRGSCADGTARIGQARSGQTGNAKQSTAQQGELGL